MHRSPAQASTHVIIILLTVDPLCSLLYRAWFDASLLRQGLTPYRCPPWSPLDTLCQATILFSLCCAWVFGGVPLLDKYIHIYDQYNVDGMPCAVERLKYHVNSFSLIANSSLEISILLTSWLLYMLYSQGLDALSMLWLSLHHPNFVPRCHFRKLLKRWAMLDEAPPGHDGPQMQSQTAGQRLFATEI